jgi:hypothetical protein
VCDFQAEHRMREAKELAGDKPTRADSKTAFIEHDQIGQRRRKVLTRRTVGRRHTTLTEPFGPQPISREDRMTGFIFRLELKDGTPAR